MTEMALTRGTVAARVEVVSEEGAWCRVRELEARFVATAAPAPLLDRPYLVMGKELRTVTSEWWRTKRRRV